MGAPPTDTSTTGALADCGVYAARRSSAVTGAALDYNRTG